MSALLKSARKLLFVLFDVVALSFSILFAFQLRLGWSLSPPYIEFLRAFFIPFIIIKLVIFFALGMYKRLWRYASVQEIRVIMQAVVLSSLTVLFFSYSLGTIPIPRTVFVVDGLLTLVTVGGIRFLGRTFSELKGYSSASTKSIGILIAGAGNAGGMLAKEMLKNPGFGYLPVGFIDDDPQKKGMKLHGVKVRGTIAELQGIVKAEDIDEVIIAMPSVNRQVKEKLVTICKQANVRCRTLPGIYELIDGRAAVRQIRDVEIEDILGREPVTVNMKEIGNFISGSVVLVTGAGGSIGSELCRQVSILGPKQLVLVDIAENSLFEIERELVERQSCSVSAVICDVKDEKRVEQLLTDYRPKIVFHAAAYKHVPLMEANPKAALENNFIGTLVMAEAAARHKVDRFVLVSTDKAVNPKNVMGLTKALAETVAAALAGPATDFVVVRFGNVLASRGSVIPIFQKQIEKGGPITITHQSMKRYLMTITESVQLVLQAAAFGGGDVFLLDMGEAVPIVEVAEKLIKLSGLTVDEIQLEYIGVRPGEKLEEELMTTTEKKTASPHASIFKLEDGREPIQLDVLKEMRKMIEDDRIKSALSHARALVKPERDQEEAAALRVVK